MKIPSESRIGVAMSSIEGGGTMPEMFTPEEALELIRNHSEYWIFIKSGFVELDSIRGLDSMAFEKEKLQPRDDVRAARRRGWGSGDGGHGAASCAR